MDIKERKEKSEYSGLVPAFDQAVGILFHLSRTQASKMNLTDICNKTVGIHKSKGNSIFNTLRKSGFVQKNNTEKTYFPGLGLIALSRRVFENLNYNEVAGPLKHEFAVCDLPGTKDIT
ncbi:MAG: hypothetical protein C0392_14055 [Syntrophus sp. (in: bacteria)]|nr:hypothetical protein [Syntrophus sp. (in: bacteria)]